MIFKRAIAKLKAQDWTAIGIEVGIVIVGVFIANQVSNWNQDRLERRETIQLLQTLKPEMLGLIDYVDKTNIYYATTGRYAETALRGWARDPAVSDTKFVIAAYQASQITGIGTNGASWAIAFGGDRLSKITDREISDPLSFLIRYNYDLIDVPALYTRYRDHVRTVIPNEIQQVIRKRCGDSVNNYGSNVLPPTCDITLPPGSASATAAALRSAPELRGELARHRAEVATVLFNTNMVGAQARRLYSALPR